ncbi:hypothetical protein AD006_31215 (plasmid) [Pseudonocardia sp. EC080610-09]|uniref:fumarylacetoacetate hydrolase family protein n=1 Tax=unclassified Pseudonocardia TaxID=2619320 RepID=UPI000706ECCB|nr:MULTISPECIES: fumarylacetoacetate hydrolase family protein [unclassified Pseudonocardia]ALL79651.1 hypothetical protein AD006_31215 [Pseudonocardia sp. EC080610-09]ALL85392.1 hypothetical protein AD017_30020 [Pseudonocardia sp. EC080619-01]
MRLALYDDYRPGIIDPEAGTITPVTIGFGHQDPDPFGAGWWVRACRDLADGSVPTVIGEPLALADVQLRAPVLNPGKVVAAASNYGDHVAEMRDTVLPASGVTGSEWLLDFDVFLKAPSSVVGPSDRIVLPNDVVADGKEIHHEGELAIVIGRGGHRISEAGAMDHVLGYTIGLDMTVRGHGDRSRRKSYPSFTPLGPWVTTVDDAGDWRDLSVSLSVNGQVRQQVSCAKMLVSIPGILSYASSVMELQPGDVILTGAPPGVGPIVEGDLVHVRIDRLGELQLPVSTEV